MSGLRRFFTPAALVWLAFAVVLLVLLTVLLGREGGNEFVYFQF